jgi:hypothetical protein
MEENDTYKSHWNTKELLNYVHEALSGHQAICIEILIETLLWKTNNMFAKCPIIKLELVDIYGRESHVEQPLHWTLVHLARKHR